MAKLLKIYGIPRGPCRIESIKISGIDIELAPPMVLAPGQRFAVVSTSDANPVELHVEENR